MKKKEKKIVISLADLEFLKKKLVEEEMATFRKEFYKHLSTFITGAFSFVAALLWRDAIKSLLERIIEVGREKLPVGGLTLQFLTAFAVTIIAVIAIVIISRILKAE